MFVLFQLIFILVSVSVTNDDPDSKTNVFYLFLFYWSLHASYKTFPMIFQQSEKAGFSFSKRAAVSRGRALTPWDVHGFTKPSQFLFSLFPVVLRRAAWSFSAANSTLIHKVGNTTLWRGV